MTPEELAARTGRALSARVESFRVLEGGYSNLSVLVVTSAARLVARHPTFTPSTWHPTLHGQATAMRLARDATSAGWTNDAHFSSAATVAERLLSAHTPTWGINTTDIEDAAQLLTETPPMRSLLVHGDAGVGNFIVADVRIAGIIDFDNAWYGDPAIDLAWWWWRSPRTAPAFEAGCASQGDITDPWPLWACRVNLLISLADSFIVHAPERARHIWQLFPTSVNQLRDTAR